MKKAINLIFPHQLFAQSPLIDNDNEVYLIEEYLFFKQYAFHKQKIAFHRASMKNYQEYLTNKGKEVSYIDSNHELSDIRKFVQEIRKEGITEINCIDPVDHWLELRLNVLSKHCTLNVIDSPQFLNTKEDLSGFFRKDKKSFFQTTFYKQQRKKLDILMDNQGQPKGGKWTYDVDNRKNIQTEKYHPRSIFPKSLSTGWKQ